MAKEGRFAKKKKKSFAWLWVLLVLLLLGGLGWFFLSDMEFPQISAGQNQTEFSTEGEKPQDTTAFAETEAVSVPPQSEPEGTTQPLEFVLTDPYKEVLNRYRLAIDEKWQFMECENNQISYMIMFHGNLDRLGYYLCDLDENGTAELIVSDGNVIYDLYTMVDGKVIWVVTGGERNSYNLCEDGLISNYAASSAASHAINFFRLEGEELVLVQGLTFEGSNEGNTWTLVTEGKAASEEIPEAQVNMIVASHKHIPITTTPMP